MNESILNRRDIAFQLYEVLQADKLNSRERFSEHSQETFDASLNTAEAIARDYFAPHNHKADADEPTFDGEKVHMSTDVKTAFDAFAEAGFIAGRYDYDDGGMQLPEVISAACMAYFTAANPSTTGYPFLTAAAANLINTFADSSLQERFVPHMLSGRFSGTMALTEPHAGSSLSDITTSAVPEDDGTYLIKGSKLYISGGDHELTDNIVHLVLAKIKGAPLGVKGISLFIVPKFLVDEDGGIGPRNGVVLTGLIHKLGYRGTTSTALSFGDDESCVGYLVGEPHQGLKYMFQMMNEARIGVGIGASVIGYRGYLYSLAYAKDRLQGRLPSNPNPESPPAPIILHADVKRMLLAQKAYVEGAVSLCLYGASLGDDIHTHPDSDGRKEAQLLLDLLTPIIKAWPSDYGVKANDLAIQVLGGAGYTREYPVEQCWRDNRLNPIHEGTNGIQALDLLGRKVWAHNGAGLAVLKQKMQQDIDSCKGSRTRSWGRNLEQAAQLAAEITVALGAAMRSRSPDLVLGNAACYLHMVGHIVVAWIWLRQALVAEAALEKVEHVDEIAFYEGKLQAAQYFFRWELPKIYCDADLLNNLDSTCLDMKPDWF